MLVTALILLVAFMILPAALGTLVLFHTLVRKKSPPVGESNRINHFRLVWFALTREDKFVKLFPWLSKDEWDNLNK
tara:strand:+ start:248 stop:475 length:228 start_codon:yes stop_codon:yes gene_type:complete